jgi:hypothetical protein
MDNQSQIKADAIQEAYMSNFKFDRSPFMSKKHLANIRKLPSCLSGRTPCEPHHLRLAEERGVGLKATDRWAIPLTHEEHMEVHMIGSKLEEQWFVDRGLLCYILARRLWDKKDDFEAMQRIVMDMVP